MPALFQPLRLRSLELQHRGWVSPMCQYSCDPDDAPGVPNDWHLMHLGSFAAGGAALILTEAAAVNAEGRISPRDAGLYNSGQAEAWQRITSFVHRHGAAEAKIGVQLAHAGRKASTYWPFSGKRGSVPESDGGWTTVGPSPLAFEGYASPAAMGADQISGVVRDFADAAVRAVDAGFDTIEIHGAHGYLLHQFQSPLINTRTDAWGGDETGRNRLMLTVVDAVRAVIPESMPLLLRISASDWAEGGVDLAASVRLARQAAEHGVDLIDVSSGGAVAHQQIKAGPGYQTGFSAAIRKEAGVATGTVGLLTSAGQAEHAVATGQADGVLIARAALRDPHWWLRAAFELGHDLAWPPQYERAVPRRTF
ncbi:NADH:flavin oxidoreductase/NADH oxidase [Pseudarthrobacter oxydans]|uniref:2,4-dienoyl-CoA reductase-like NADH-dependent reductase (Old Yellow Enzyme family) n=1 Tax=Pseudarthrobacter oxydans TaxID=1671 RepID=A0AAW8N7S7_PSEOX|nr:NADH:flavin oxidoreductase/NADH oxidase [Pseudarthrobacter oxydans]MDR6792287.1 2,4-dienoyl-CoA reductase-like NADH-dependent reductase (Old Yellow Enzyme family) [Pseudarthrobacter oxydans]MDR7162018.1 2,4-dienoyl-CoA reductase-like NADH-dependent reductase (Old Yellow Enzyme family) [Pseudarthrobacter oxydans]WHP57881.1 NADH:flavin oxidoreductase/NADH oxidase [Arthrobacter sp. KFRI-F3372]BFE45462.1 NADH:flavin oxidoreductase/NADH oxidase [Pseudarthrobacter oxydans]